MSVQAHVAIELHDGKYVLFVMEESHLAALQLFVRKAHLCEKRELNGEVVYVADGTQTSVVKSISFASDEKTMDEDEFQQRKAGTFKEKQEQRGMHPIFALLRQAGAQIEEDDDKPNLQ